MNAQKIHKLLSILILMIFVLASCSACAGPASLMPAWPASIATEDIADTIAKFQEEIPQHMLQDNIPGLAIAVVDDQGILWEEGFGYTDWDRRTPVTPATLFNIQSTSKSFTGTAAMFAAQDGLVDLDAPITTYLPNFTVHSIFEDHPEQKMTLRILLSHTAGFPHDPVYGGNYDNSPYSFEKHIASISDTRLMFPVGARYSYSNIGIDLAGYILQVRSGMSFIQYVQQKVFDPLGMKASTLDINRVRATATRAIGHNGSPLRPPIDFMLIPSGGVWTSAEDLARYVQFHINKGSLDGKSLLREDLAETMYTPPNVPANLNNYGLGIASDIIHGVRQLQHGGGGFGFNSQIAWYPELKLGVAVLLNSHTPDGYGYLLSQEVMDSIIDGNWKLYGDRMESAAHSAPAYPPSRDSTVLSDNDLQALIERKALPEDAASQQRRSAAAGTYIMTFWGFPADTIEINNQYGVLSYTYSGGLSMFGNSGPLTEVERGYYYAPTGLTFDLRGPTPLVTEIRLIKANTQALPFQEAFYALCGLVFLSALFFWPARAVVRGLRRKNLPLDGGVRPPRSSGLLWAGVLAALAALFSLLCLAVVALVPNMVYVPWPRPWVDLLWWQSALVDLPFASLLLGFGVGLLAVLGLRGRAVRWYYLAVGLALIAFNGIIII